MIFPARVLRTHTFGLLLLGLQPLCSEAVSYTHLTLPTIYSV